MNVEFPLKMGPLEFAYVYRRNPSHPVMSGLSSAWQQRKGPLSPTCSSQELAFFNLELLEDIGKQVGANSFSRMNRDRSPATVFMVKYSVTALLANLLKPQCLKPLNHLPGFKGR
jgi:hypothetical protein